MASYEKYIGLDIEETYQAILSKDVPAAYAAELVTELIKVNLGMTARSFRFTPGLSTATPQSCSPTFTRTFEHAEWVDGQSVVQAGESATDKGMNWRFRALRSDVDALHADTQRLHACLVELRSALVAALEQVAAELNRVNVDLAQRPHAEQRQVGPITKAPKFAGVRELDGKRVTMWEVDDTVLVLPGVETIAVGPTVKQRLATGAEVYRAATNHPEIEDALAQGATIAEVRRRLGGIVLDDGRTLGQALTVLSPSAQHADVAALVDAINTQEQTVLRATVGSKESVAVVTGVATQQEPESVDAGTLVGELGVRGVAGGRDRVVEMVSGLWTVKDVAAMEPQALASALGEHGVAATQAQAAELQVRARMLAGLGR